MYRQITLGERLLRQEGYEWTLIDYPLVTPFLGVEWVDTLSFYSCSRVPLEGTIHRRVGVGESKDLISDTVDGKVTCLWTSSVLRSTFTPVSEIRGRGGSPRGPREVGSKTHLKKKSTTREPKSLWRVRKRGKGKEDSPDVRGGQRRGHNGVRNNLKEAARV